MIQRITQTPGKILAFDASGNVTARDYEKVIIPAVNKTISNGNDIRFLYHFGKKFKSMEFGAMIDDVLLSIKYFTHWKRVAVVTDKKWIRNATRAMGIFWPGHIKTYGDKDLKKAYTWLQK